MSPIPCDVTYVALLNHRGSGLAYSEAAPRMSTFQFVPNLFAGNRPRTQSFYVSGFLVVVPTGFNGSWITYADSNTFSDKWNGLSTDLGVKGYIKQILF